MVASRWLLHDGCFASSPFYRSFSFEQCRANAMLLFDKELSYKRDTKTGTERMLQ